MKKDEKEDINNISKNLEKELERIKNDEEIKFDQSNSVDFESTEEIKITEDEKDIKQKKHPKWVKPVGITCLVMTFIAIVSVLYLRGLASKFQYEDPSSITHQEEEFDIDVEGDIEEVTEPITLETNDNPNGPRYEKNIINILLIGEDRNPGGGGRGRSDVIMIATIDKTQKALKLTSIMRDSYVQIPGYRANKINAAFSTGGAPLLVSTIEENFDIKIDGYAWTKFEDFETLIDKLGGVGITLTRTEARYLNSTNYISNSKYRNVKEGYQTLNGTQALGYARVRYVGNADFERTNRQRKVLIAIFDKYKSVGLTKALETLDYILPQVRTNMMPADIISYATNVISLGAKEIQTLRIPIDKGYESKTVNRMSVLVPDLKKNVSELHKFIFESERSVASQ